MLAQAIRNVFSSFPFGYGAIGTVGYSLEYPRRVVPSLQYSGIIPAPQDGPSALTHHSLCLFWGYYYYHCCYYFTWLETILDGWLIPVVMTREQLLGASELTRSCYRYRYCYPNSTLLPQYGAPYHTHSTYIK